ncbi:MAG: hemolysin family protein [Rhabdochlamydiaceae bacterium]|nr:hemolysin family protein [Rhabdochlamydiaceae bacterium]
MHESWKFFLGLTLSCLVIQGFFAMVELACVSFNKVRLQYYVSKGKRRAIWLSYLISHPALLFGTSLIGVNTALILGSECSRRFYDALGLNPDFAPITQIIVVLLFAEISPMIAGRRYAESVAMFGVPILFLFSILLRPLIWALDILCRGLNHLIGTPVASGAYLSREELQNIIEEREETIVSETNRKEFNTVVSHIFMLKNQTAKDMMLALEAVPMIPSASSVADLRIQLAEKHTSFVPLFHRNPQNIVAIAYPRDLLRVSEVRKVREFARSPWFITESTSILQILKQFRRNNESLAVVLNEAGLATGFLTLDEIIDELFGRSDEWMSFGDMIPRAYHIVVDRTFPGDMRLEDFNLQFNVHLSYLDAKTLDELVTKALGHPPSKGESVRIDQFELTVEEASLLGAKSILVRTVF